MTDIINGRKAEQCAPEQQPMNVTRKEFEALREFVMSQERAIKILGRRLNELKPAVKPKIEGSIKI